MEKRTAFDLSDVPEKLLHGEIVRRSSLRAGGFCDYCGRNTAISTMCKQRERHLAAVAPSVQRDPLELPKAVSSARRALEASTYRGVTLDERVLKVLLRHAGENVA